MSQAKAADGEKGKRTGSISAARTMGQTHFVWAVPFCCSLFSLNSTHSIASAFYYDAPEAEADAAQTAALLAAAPAAAC
jgi:hypothetical protein